VLYNLNNFNPLDQFEIREFLSISMLDHRLCFTNISFYILLASGIALYGSVFLNNNGHLLPTKSSLLYETIYDTINNIVVNQINKNKGQEYFPFIFILFLFILINNLVGITPYSFASTSHFILTFSLSFTVVIGATLLGFQLHVLKFFSIFVPNGCPLPLLPLLVIIEFISYLARNVSLGLRLAANILSGHMLLNILSGFVYNIMNSGFIFFFVGLLPLTFIIAFSGLEFAIAFIQAQVFVVLSSGYIKDGLELH
jgi:F-type H+-transporting ATPase subunit a